MPPDPVHSRALKLLAGRAYSVRGLRERLLRSGFDAQAVGPVLVRLQELRLLDDAALARSRAEGLLRERRLAPAAAVRRLVAQGIPEPLALEAVGALHGEGGERQAALELLSRRHPRVDSRSPRAERLRAARLLASHGFEEELVRSLLGLDEGSDG